MNFRVTSAANADIDAIILYLNKQRQNLGWVFYESILSEFIAIGTNPRRCPTIDPQFRRCLLRRFQYLIVYEPLEKPQIVAVYHHSRHQDFWRMR